MPIYRFNDHELVPETRLLLHEGRDIALGSRVFDLVAYLIQHRQRAVGRDELMSAVWGRVDVGDAALAQAVLKARRALGEGSAATYIRTVARFGYQWVAPTLELATSKSVAAVVLPSETSAPEAQDRAPVPEISVVREHRVGRVGPKWMLALAAFAVIGIGVWLLPMHGANESLKHGARSDAATVPGLILVTPTVVHSVAADDGWMRLGVMSLSSRALSTVPGHAVVPDETAVAVAAHAGPASGVQQLRAATGAAIVISSEANRIGEDWRIEATVLNADGSAQLVDARAADAVTAAGNLAHRLRDLLAPEGNGDAAEAAAPGVLMLAARMKAAILEAQSGRALTLLAQAPASAVGSPPIVLLQAEALNQLGRMQDAIDVLRPLIDQGTTAPAKPTWLPDAWTALGDSELALGQPALAEPYFRHAIQLDGVATRRSLGLAWRGLGISQIVRNDLDDGEQSYLRARLELEPVGDRLLLARITDGLAYVATTRGRVADALMLYEQAAEMGAAAGLNETELGSRLNVAQSHQYLLHHTLALEKLRTLMPRIEAVDYPALHRFGTIEYTNALVETGALADARGELAKLAANAPAEGTADAVIDVRLDEAQIELALGDPASAIQLAQAARRDHTLKNAADLHLDAVATLLDAYVAGGDDKSAAQLAVDETNWASGSARAPARLHALVARARWSSRSGDAAATIDRYRQALALARDSGAPVLLRDAAVPYAQFQLDAGAIDAARATAAIVGPYAEDDFAIALLMARTAAASDERNLAKSYFALARRLAGERWTTAFGEEEVRASAESALPGRTSRPAIADR